MTWLAAAPVSPVALAAAPEATEGSSDAEAMFRRGQAKYETADYNGAIELWTEAYALIDNTPENASIKALIMYNLAQAHAKAFELDEDAIHLKQALQLLQNFKGSLELLYDDEAALAEEAEKVDARIAELEARIAEPDEKPEPEPEPDEPPPPAVEPPAGGEPVDGPPSKSGTPLLAAGGVLAFLGVGGGVAAIVGGVVASNANDISDLQPNQLEEREQRFRKGQTGNALLISGSIGAGVLIPTGVALMIVGVLRNKKAKAAGHTALLPSLGPRGGGLVLSGSF